jgi:hypothetical protein
VIILAEKKTDPQQETEGVGIVSVNGFDFLPKIQTRSLRVRRGSTVKPSPVNGPKRCWSAMSWR